MTTRLNLRRSLTTLLCLSAFPFILSAQTDTAPAKESDAKKSPPEEQKVDPNELLRRAVTTMSGLTSYHASGTFSAGGGTATLGGDFGVGSVDMQVKGFDRKTTFRRGVKDGFWISHDSGKSWQVDPANEMTALLSTVVTAPLNAESKAWEQGKFKIVGEEKIGKEDVLHIQKPKEGDSAAMDFWLAKDEKLGLVVRKANLVIAATDGEFPVEMTYTKLNVPVKIEAPTTAKPDKKEK
jgi:hypothetical protein